MSRVKGITKLEKAGEERQAVTGMIIDIQFLRQIRPITKLEYFKAPFAKTVAQWCLDYWDQYEEAPGRQIEELYHAKERAGELDDDQVDIIGQFLESLSEEYERGEKRSTEYVARTTETYFRRRALEILKEDINNALANRDVDQAELTLAQYRTPARENGQHINPFTNEEAIQEAFTQSNEPLFRLPGALGEALNDLFVRDGFLAIMAPEKRGKSWIMMYLSKRAAMARVNVAWFAVGDMTKPQMTVRYHIMHTHRSHRKKYCGDILVPVVDCVRNQDGSCDLVEREGEGDLVKTAGRDSKHTVFQEYKERPDWTPCAYCARDRVLKNKFVGACWHRERKAVEPLDWRDAVKAGKEFADKVMRERQFYLDCYPNSSINVQGIDNALALWEAKDGFVPDVILIDYADILAPEDGRKDFRHQQNETWKALRKLSQTRNCLVVTATQADAASYSQKMINESNFSEDKRKYSHVTGVITLNQEAAEKKKGVMRIGTMFLREDDFDTTRAVTVLQSLATGQPVLGSYF
jgi:hypothetical protein